MSEASFDKVKFYSYFQEALPGDEDKNNYTRQVNQACYSYVAPKKAPSPKILAYSDEVANSLGFDEHFCRSQSFAQLFSGNQTLPGMQPYSSCYGGHQFGNWAGQLGDGRAINLGELKDTEGKLQVLQLKGAGPTPYSRFADGYAVLRSSIREFLCSEAMHYLGVPTTRALSLIASGRQVERDMFYDGNAQLEPGAIVCRVSPSFTRFGSFEIFTSRNDLSTLEKLVAYTIENDFPHLWEMYQKDSKQALALWFKEVASRTCELIVHWMRVGFVHGVLNTDNMSILGLTIDYGPYGWLDDFDPTWTPNTTDFQQRRYRYENQPAVGQWNLLQLGNAIYPLIEDASLLESIIRDFSSDYENRWLDMMHDKLGLDSKSKIEAEFFVELQGLMAQSKLDMTRFYSGLTNNDLLRDSFRQNRFEVFESFLADETYLPQGIDKDLIDSWIAWFKQYCSHVNESEYYDKVGRGKMKRSNPVFILRNYLAQQAIDAAHEGDYSKLNELLQTLKTPYDDKCKPAEVLAKRPQWAEDKAGCSTLSCSS